MTSEVDRAFLRGDVSKLRELHLRRHKISDGLRPDLVRLAITQGLEKNNTDMLSYLISQCYQMVQWKDVIDIEITKQSPVHQFLINKRVWRTLVDWEMYIEQHKDTVRVDLLEQRIADLEDMVNALWYSPGMPGYAQAKESFESIQPRSDTTN